MHYLVARFADGRVLKGTALGLDFPDGTFRMDVTSGQGHTGPAELRTGELKALFGVKELDGDPKRVDKKAFIGPRPRGAATVRFQDGEVMVGVIPDYEPGSEFFYIVPADAKSNNIWCYVSAAASEEVCFLQPGGSDVPGSGFPLIGGMVALVLSLAGLAHVRRP